MERSSEIEDAPLLERKSKYGRRLIIKGYISMLLAMLCYIAALSSAQVAGNKISIFVVNMFRFVFEILFSLVCVWLGGHSLKVAKNDILKMIFAAVCNLVFVSLLYLSSTLLPVGNMDGVYGGLYIATTTFVDAIRRQISKWSVCAALIAGVGLIFLTQPWHSFKGTAISPCDYIDNNYSFNISATVANSTGNMSMTINPMFHWITPERLGYIYITLGTLITSVGDIVIRSLLQTYTIYNFLFWAGIIQSVITACILAGMGFLQLSDLSFPTGTTCLIVTIALIITMTLAHILLNITLVYLPVSKAAMVTPVATISLYIIQRTLLKMFHPGHANSMEIVGIMAIIIAGILAPIVSIFHESEE